MADPVLYPPGLRHGRLHGGDREDPVFLEGDYSRWAIYSRYETGLPADMDDFITVRDDGVIYFLDDSAQTVSIVSKEGVTIEVKPDLYAFPVNFLSTVLGRYTLMIDSNVDYILVQEGETETWRRSPDLDKGPYALAVPPICGDIAAAISPRGEWILMYVEEAVTANGLLFLYRGEP